MEQSQHGTRIKWLHDFYNWSPVAKGFFSETDYVTINGNIQLVRINPAVADAHLFVASNLQFLGDFQLFQCDSPSVIRRNMPVRFFYSRKHGKVFELTGVNTPFYEMMSFLNSVRSEMLDGSDINTWLEKNTMTYIRMFFDNVAGRHGRFEIVDNYEELYYRITTYQRYLSRNNTPSANTGEPPAGQIDFQRRIRDVFTSEPRTIQREEQYMVARNVYMVFKESLFTASVLFDTEDFGMTSLADEKLIDYASFFPQPSTTEIPALDSLFAIPPDQLGEDPATSPTALLDAPDA